MKLQCFTLRSIVSQSDQIILVERQGSEGEPDTRPAVFLASNLTILYVVGVRNDCLRETTSKLGCVPYAACVNRCAYSERRPLRASEKREAKF